MPAKAWMQLVLRLRRSYIKHEPVGVAGSKQILV
jgi:hypothetical protein